MAIAPVMFNGKFLSAHMTGVHRVAAALITHADERLAAAADGDARAWSLVGPRDARAPLPLRFVQRRTAGVLTWQPWEQFELPRIARRAVLVNLCNMAPLSHHRAVTMIHDAQVFLTPDSYSRPFRTWYHFALPRIGAAAVRVLTVSHYSADRLVEFGVTTRDKIDVLYNGVDHLSAVPADASILARLGLRPGRFVVAAGNAQAHKNVALLFEVFADAPPAGLTLVLAGPDGADAFAARGHTPPASVVFAGRVSDAALRALYENAACLAFPSTTEGFGLPPLEAMSLGCPAVAAPRGALPEVCGEAAVYAAHDDPSAWAAAIAQVAEPGPDRASRVAAGRAQAARYRWGDSAGRLIDIIRSV